MGVTVRFNLVVDRNRKSSIRHDLVHVVFIFYKERNYYHLLITRDVLDVYIKVLPYMP